MALSPASGIGRYLPTSRLVIRFVRHGCTNREFFHIVVAEVYHSFMFLCAAPPKSTFLPYFPSFLPIIGLQRAICACYRTTGLIRSHAE